MSKTKEKEVILKALNKLPRDDMRVLCRKMGAPTGRNKNNTVENLTKALVG